MSFFKKTIYLLIIGNILINYGHASDQSFFNWIKDKSDEMSARISYATSDVGYGSSIELIDPFLEKLLSKKMSLQKGEFTYLLTPEDEKALGPTSLLNLAFQVAKSNFDTYKSSISSRDFCQNIYEMDKKFLELKKATNTNAALVFAELDDSELSQLDCSKLKSATEALKKAGEEYGLSEDTTEIEYLNSIKTLSVPYLYQVNSDKILIVPFTPRTSKIIGGKVFFTDGLLCAESKNAVVSLAEKYFKHLLQTFPSKQLCIYGLSGDEKHFTYPQIKLTSSHLDVTVYDSMSEILPELKGIRQLFTDLSKQLGTVLSYQYKSVGNQVFNMHDCGRFATVYLLYDLLENKTPLSLKPQDIQKGFKMLKDEGYEHFQKNPDPSWSYGYVESIT